MSNETLNHQDFYMPAEWEQHEGTWLQWPNDKHFARQRLMFERVWLTMVEALHDNENVHIIVEDESQRDHVIYLLRSYGIGEKNTDFCVIPFDDIWVRDNGPIFVLDERGNLAITNWRFNGWGGRHNFPLDDRVPAVIGEQLSVPVFEPPLVLEGGAVEVNGKGTFMATRASILNTNRNPNIRQAEVEATLKDYLGVEHFIWLTGAGTPECDQWGDDTDSHIDIVARFTSDSTVLYNWSEDESDPRFPMLARHYDELQSASTESGKSLTLVRLPVPSNGVHRISKNKTFSTTLTDAAYSNYLVANEVVLVPVFGNVNDQRAKKIIQEQFPDRQVIGIDVVSLNENGGAIHCVTQQQPKGTA
jgi:agmatine deiminase